ncbi:hypothetical protein ACUV84_008773 [Puccinellia chinampoensis]
MRDRQERRPLLEPRGRDENDEDRGQRRHDDNPRRGRSEERSWAQRLFRSRSRQGRYRDNVRGHDRNERREDGRDERYDRRPRGRDGNNEGRDRRRRDDNVRRGCADNRQRLFRSRSRRGRHDRNERRDAGHEERNDRRRSTYDAPDASPPRHRGCVPTVGGRARGRSCIPSPCTNITAARNASPASTILPPPPAHTPPAATVAAAWQRACGTPSRIPIARLRRNACGKLVWRRVEKSQDVLAVEAVAPTLPPLDRAPGFNIADAESEPVTPLYFPLSSQARSMAPGTESDGNENENENENEGNENEPGFSINRSRDPLFWPAQEALLGSPPASPRPPPPANRRMTFAAGFTVPRSSIRIKEAHKGVQIARRAEKNLCRRLGIVAEDAEVSEQAINEFVKMFQSQIPSNAIAALRALFRLDCDHAGAVEEALLRHGGAGALDQEVQADDQA